MEQKKYQQNHTFSSRISSVPLGKKQTKEGSRGQSEMKALCSPTVLNTEARGSCYFKGIHLKGGLNFSFIFPITLCPEYKYTLKPF